MHGGSHVCACACVLWSEHVPVSDVLDSWLSVPLDYYNPGLEYMVWPREIISLLFRKLLLSVWDERHELKERVHNTG